MTVAKYQNGLLVALGTVALAAVVAVGAGTVAAEEHSYPVTVNSPDGTPVPVSINMGLLRDQLPKDFLVNWDTLRVIDARGQEIPYQIDDIDLSGQLSRDDELAFLATGPVTIKVSDDEFADLPAYEDLFTAETTDKGEVKIATRDGQLGAVVTPFRTVNITRFGGVDQTYVKDLGLVRYAGFPLSRYWSKGGLGQHEEKTTYEEPLRVVKSQVLKASPVRLTVVDQYASDLFAGLRVNVAISIYPTGDIHVRTVVPIRAYTDLTKLLVVVNNVMGDAPDARHILVPFRWLDFAAEEGKTSAEYYAARNSTVEVDGQTYLAFTDNHGPQPPFWGASYIFASVERWRTNFSPSQGVGVAEIIPNPPAVGDSLVDKLKGEGWQLESEWRTGYFRWVATEILQRRLDNGQKVEEFEPDMEKGDWPLHAQPGDTFTFDNWYKLYKAADIPAAVRLLEQQVKVLNGVQVGAVQ
ncbi:MAG: hypothetical protein IMX01_08040 [Limnochordaceae bacterium]|nr:hypothetical protein [Limnochordaceae bacterium]